MSLAFAEHLQDFSSSTPFTQVVPVPQLPQGSKFEEQEQPVNLEAEKANAYQEGYDAAVAKLAEEKKQELDACQEAHIASLRARESELGQELANQIVGSLGIQINEIVQQMTSEVGAILAKIIDENLLRNSLIELENIIRDSLTKKPNARINISGPRILLEKIEDQMSAVVADCKLVETQNSEIKLEIDQTLISTKLAEWRQQLGSDAS